LDIIEFVFKGIMYWKLSPQHGMLKGGRTFKRWDLGQVQWLTPVILACWEAEIGKIGV
jgi:hypothetical protein